MVVGCISNSVYEANHERHFLKHQQQHLDDFEATSYHQPMVSHWVATRLRVSWVPAPRRC